MSNQPPSHSPVYLMSSERSGTNLLRKLLTQHQKQYFAPPPAHFLKHLYTTEPYYDKSGESGADGFVEMIRDALNLCYVHWSPWEIQLDAEKVYSEYAEEFDVFNSIYLSHFLMTKYARSVGFETYFCKDNHIFDYVFEIINFIPQSKFIYLYRDPRDYTLSQKKRRAQTDSIRKIAKLWRDEQVKCLAAVAHMRSEQVYQLSYEQLVTDPDHEVEKLCTFLGAEYTTQSNDQPVVTGDLQIAEWENLSKPVMKQNINKYVSHLSRHELKHIEAIANRQMMVLGYDTIDAGPPSVLSQVFDEVGLSLYSFIRKRLLSNKQDRVVAPRRAVTRAIAKRRRA